METKDGKVAVYAKNRRQWRSWLQKNAGKQEPVWLILFHKGSSMQSVDRIAATEEALCFGWIDSLCKKRDAGSYYLTFSPRNSRKSSWSQPNIERAKRLISEGKMTEEGLRLIEIAKRKGGWQEA
ncbi:YdeI/OmpD-associated family protein [Niabella drilacis]|uniref:Bacteriocin-protection, YdeI or OmpD-Associated n=1 Tax=Niabella drilacis (strain DSM 25811 / CCM 8410 / CCUG 62505 / LMG 26954 / E90) TaxID=1285928 RepID=A0A1G6ZS39_NIADE|nr:hypothetical protein [Niabella drilacis]SDE05594.1 hypothetical protein SAMN04487894_11946 [Niabella drilacis]